MNIIGKMLLNLLITGLLLGFGFWLVIASTMGPAYLPKVMEGGLDMWIRFIMLSISTMIWLVTPIWCIWSGGRYSYSNYKAYKRDKLTNTPL